MIKNATCLTWLMSSFYTCVSLWQQSVAFFPSISSGFAVIYNEGWAKLYPVLSAFSVSKFLVSKNHIRTSCANFIRTSCMWDALKQQPHMWGPYTQQSACGMLWSSNPTCGGHTRSRVLYILSRNVNSCSLLKFIANLSICRNRNPCVLQNQETSKH